MVKIGIKPLKKTALPIFLMFCDVELHQLLTTALLLTVCISIIFCHCKEPPPPPYLYRNTSMCASYHAWQAGHVKHITFEKLAGFACI